MYRVGLVQNQSEMAHYGYADARPLLRRLGYEVDLYTADNVDDLGSELSHYDALVLASNALNDKTIRQQFDSDDLRASLKDRIDQGMGILLLHQLKLAQAGEAEKRSSLSFLGSTLGPVSAKIRPPEERSAEGFLKIPSEARRHTTVLYPHPIDADRLRSQALSFRSLPGLYWHYWEQLDLADWDALVLDESYEGKARVLVACTKESALHRVVVSALTLDWQQQASFLENLLTFVVEGRHNSAFLSHEKRSSTAYEFLKSTLASRKFPHQEYFTGQDLSPLRRNLEEGVHRILLLGPFVKEQALSEDLRATVGDLVRRGELNLLSIEPGEGGVGSVSLSGRERFAARILQETELRIQSELRNGSIDGSFWSTAETLQTLEELEESKARYENLIDRALTEADTHDRSGSYDEVFGVTCAFYWMRATYRGTGSPEAQSTRSWINENIEAYDLREQCLALKTFAYTDTLTATEKRRLGEMLASLTPSHLSEIDLINYLQAALAIHDLERIPEFVDELGKRQNDGSWVDLATSATAAAALIDALDAMRRGHPSYGDLQPRIEGMIFKTVNLIQEEYERSTTRGRPGTYPWDGKASTTVKCLQAWLRFDRLLDLPVYEVVEVLSRRDQHATAAASGRTALEVLEELKQENDVLRESRDALAKLVTTLRPQKLARKRASFAAGLLVYILLSVLVGAVQSGGARNLADILTAGFARNWGYHLSFAAVAVAALVGIPVLKNYFGPREADRGDAEA